MTAKPIPDPIDEDAEEDEEVEFEVPDDEEGKPAKKRYGKACLPSVDNAETSNQTLIKWLPKKRLIGDLLKADAAEKTAYITGSEPAKVLVAYQIATDVAWGGATASVCGRTLEEAFGLENAEWCQAIERKDVGLKLKKAPEDIAALAEGLHKRVGGKHFDKTKFALEIMASGTEGWTTPKYIRDGLRVRTH